MTDLRHEPRIEVPHELQLPSFTELFTDRAAAVWCPAHEVLTPRNAAQLWAAAVALADTLDEQRCDVEEPVLPCDSEWRRMPWLVQGAQPDWLGRFVDCVVNLADDVAAGRCPIPRCTAEELALQLVVEDVVEPGDHRSADLARNVCSGLPTREWDQEWDEVAASLFPYPVVRRLVADGFGGHVDDYDLVAETGLARLAVHRWFDPLDDGTPPRPEHACDCARSLRRRGGTSGRAWRSLLTTSPAT
jgi:hypothetical protein